MGHLDGLKGSGTRAKYGTEHIRHGMRQWAKSQMEGPASRKGKSERKSVAGLEVRLRFRVHPQSHGEHLVIVSTPSPFAE